MNNIFGWFAFFLSYIYMYVCIYTLLSLRCSISHTRITKHWRDCKKPFRRPSPDGEVGPSIMVAQITVSKCQPSDTLSTTSMGARCPNPYMLCLESMYCPCLSDDSKWNIRSKISFRYIKNLCALLYCDALSPFPSPTHTHTHTHTHTNSAMSASTPRHRRASYENLVNTPGKPNLARS